MTRPTAGHWRIEILPRVNPLAGVELATQIFINPISPNRAAQQLSIGLLSTKGDSSGVRSSDFDRPDQ